VVSVQSTTGYPNTDRSVREEEYVEGVLHPAYFFPGTAWRFIDGVAEMFRRKSDMEIAFFRPSNVYGPRNSFDPKFSHVIEATVRKVAERQDPFVIWGTGNEVRDAIYVDDLAEAMTMGAHCPQGAYNVGSGEEMTVNEIVSTLCAHAGFSPKVQHDLSRPTAIPARRVNCEKLLSLGWRPQVSMKDGLHRTLDWYVKQGAQCLAA
jgi:GDP-L-fucose synthase